MDLEDVKISRRNFLKLLGAATAGVVGIHAIRMDVEGPVCYHDLAGLTGAIAPRTRWFHPHWAVVNDSILSTSLIVDHSAAGDGELGLFWTGPGEQEFGWWADYLQLIEGPEGKWVDGRLAIPETVGRFQGLGSDIVTRSELGSLKMVPGELLNINLYAPVVTAPWRFQFGEGPEGWGDGEVTIHGLQLAYQA